MPSRDLNREIAIRVRDEIDRQGTTQLAVAKAMGWPQQRLARRLTSADYAAPFAAAELADVARVLGVPLSALLPTDDQPAQVTA